jgi:hypothetical protein
MFIHQPGGPVKPRFVGLLVAALAFTAAEIRAQGPSLTAFRSERELTGFLRSLEPPPPPPRVPSPASSPPVVLPLPPIPTELVTEGPVEQWPAVITGRVTEQGSGQPLQGVQVSHAGTSVNVVSNTDGIFRMVIPRDQFQAGGRATIRAARVGFTAGTRTVTLHPGAQITVGFTLSPDVLGLDELVVMGYGTATESITNNQQEGADEGGIVKVHGDYLVMLRRGRLFTVDVGGGRLRAVDAVDAFGPGVDPDGAWYDELLVSDGHVVVIGYSHERGGTEVGLFSIGRDGRLRHRPTYHLRSNDYYSAGNFASRLVGGKLVLYAPVGVGKAHDITEWMPAMRRWHPGALEEEFQPTLRPTRIYRPGRKVEHGDHLLLHTVTTCGLDDGELDCESAAVLGPEGRVFYVSSTAVYVWVSDWWVEGGPRRASSMVYRMPLDGSAVAALGVEGAPHDQFSFLENDGHLNVLVRSEGMGEAMWAAQWSDGDVRLLRVPLARFGNGRRQAPRTAYRILPRPDDDHDTFHNRFVGRHLLYGTGSGWDVPESGGSTLYAVRYRDGGLAQVRLPHGVDRIEVMGSDAVVVGADSANLHFTGIRLRGAPRIAQRYVERQASQGETRSHGFFYRADRADEGVLALPVRGPGRPGYEHLFDESASILFLRNADAQFRPLGELEARPENESDDGCVASCVDWYGNARPIFLRGRTFALLGYEIVEGALDDGRLREVRRVSFAPPAAPAAR